MDDEISIDWHLDTEFKLRSLLVIFNWELGAAFIDNRTENYGASWSAFECGEFAGSCDQRHRRT